MTGRNDICVRATRTQDLPVLLQLMRELAAFERYLDRFAVTESELLRRGFPREGPPEFFALLAQTAADQSVGYAAYYFLPFTFDLKPTLVLKELFVQVDHRSKGVGRLLLDSVLAQALSHSCGKIQWAVLPDNDRAKTFYSRWGGTRDRDWEHWHRNVGLVKLKRLDDQ